MRLKRSLYGPQDPRGPSAGRDVKDFVKRSLNRVETDYFPKKPGGWDDVYNDQVVQAIKLLQRDNHIKPVTGNMGAETFDLLWREYADAYARWVYRIWKAPKPKPEPPPLVEPLQGWASLDKSLWEDFSIGRGMGLTDLGTYNPSSRLPSGAPSDHAVWPAFAFDLGFSPQSGYAHPTANAFFKLMMGRAEVEYVILGNRIWSRARGLHSYTGGGHEGHCHTSGVR